LSCAICIGRKYCELVLAFGKQPVMDEQTQLLREIRTLVGSRWVSQAIYAAVELGIVDVLDGEKRTAEQIADAVGAHAGATARLLRALATLGIVEAVVDGEFALTALGSLLREDGAHGADSVRGSVLLTLGPSAWRAWGALVDCVRTGDIAAKVLDGVDDPFDAFATDDAERVFNQAMAEGTRRIARAVADAYDFSGVATLVDVGGGYGALVPPVLAAHPAMTAIVYDLPRCERGATELLAAAGVSDRCRVEAGDFFVDPLPYGADAYVLKSVVHDFDDDQVAELLDNCWRAAAPQTRLLVIETVVPDEIGTSIEDRWMAAADLNMLIATGGRERTETEYRTLLRAAGFEVAAIVPTTFGLAVIEARCG
jgi:hypothetical protein